MQAVLIDLHYLPSLEYFCAIRSCGELYLERKEHFEKQSFRNRCHINTTQGVELLSVPVTGKHGKVSTGEILVDYRTKWQNKHWRALESAYRKSPFFEHYEDDLKKILFSSPQFLFDLSREMLSFCLKSLQWQIALKETDVYQKEPNSFIFDLRNHITTRETYGERPFYHPASYYQVFGNRFEENLSILDLLFCAGPNAAQILLTSGGKR